MTGVTLGAPGSSMSSQAWTTSSRLPSRSEEERVAHTSADDLAEEHQLRPPWARSAPSRARARMAARTASSISASLPHRRSRPTAPAVRMDAIRMGAAFSASFAQMHHVHRRRDLEGVEGVVPQHEHAAARLVEQGRVVRRDLANDLVGHGSGAGGPPSGDARGRTGSRARREHLALVLRVDLEAAVVPLGHERARRDVAPLERDVEDAGSPRCPGAPPARTRSPPRRGSSRPPSLAHEGGELRLHLSMKAAPRSSMLVSEARGTRVRPGAGARRRARGGR